jgi:hypothetical protein
MSQYTFKSQFEGECYPGVLVLAIFLGQLIFLAADIIGGAYLVIGDIVFFVS